MRRVVSTDYTEVTEVPGSRATAAQLAMLHTRYAVASEYCDGKDVLEVGCGAGMGLGLLSCRARSIVGGDRTRSLIQLAHDHYDGRVGLCCLDAHYLPFNDRCFDVVILFEAIYYLSQPESFLQECRRLLRPEGVLLVCSANKECPEFVASRYGLRYYSAHELLDVLQRHGFDAKLFGAFPPGLTSPGQRLISTLRKAASALNLIPGSLNAREHLKRVFYGKLTVLSEEIGGEGTEAYSLEPIDRGSSSREYKVLYAIARAG